MKLGVKNAYSISNVWCSTLTQTSVSLDIKIYDKYKKYYSGDECGVTTEVSYKRQASQPGKQLKNKKLYRCDLLISLFLIDGLITEDR